MTLMFCVWGVSFLISIFLSRLGAQDSSLKLWDLRKLKNFKTITLDNNYEVCCFCNVFIFCILDCYYWLSQNAYVKRQLFLSFSCRWNLWSLIRVGRIWLLVGQTLEFISVNNGLRSSTFLVSVIRLSLIYFSFVTLRKTWWLSCAFIEVKSSNSKRVWSIIALGSFLSTSNLQQNG